MQIQNKYHSGAILKVHVDVRNSIQSGKKTSTIS